MRLSLQYDDLLPPKMDIIHACSTCMQYMHMALLLKFSMQYMLIMISMHAICMCTHVAHVHYTYTLAQHVYMCRVEYIAIGHVM